MDAYATDAIRNVVTLSHSGAGKTALAEAMLHGSGAVSRLGTIADGNTVCDYEPEEIDRKSSIQLALAPTEWNGVKINWIDTPGYADFSGEVGSALAAADFAALVISAVDGVEVGAESTWRQAEARGLPRMIVINKMDRENADFYQVLDEIKERLDRRFVPFNLPDGAETAFGGVVGLIEAGGAVERFDEFHEQLVEAAAESEDALTEKYLEEGELTPDENTPGSQAERRLGDDLPRRRDVGHQRDWRCRASRPAQRLCSQPRRRAAGPGARRVGRRRRGLAQ